MNQLEALATVSKVKVYFEKAAHLPIDGVAFGVRSGFLGADVEE